VYSPDTRALVDTLLQDLREAPAAYTFLHLRDPDHRGHWFGWRLWWWHPYMGAVRRADRLVGQVLDLVEQDPRLAGQTVVILTADHGGSRHNHYERHPLHYTVPFYVWGAGVPPGDLYALNAGRRLDPGEGRPGFDAPLQPIRNGSAANLALGLLGLGPVPGSTINADTPMRVAPVAPAGRP
jgi:Type I phosphodiesterase / nucleotide pyrophosphatase